MKMREIAPFAKKAFISAVVLLIVLIGITVTLSYYSKHDTVVWLHPERSYLNSWYIDEGIVYYDCHLVFCSDVNEEITFQISAFSEKDYQAQLISTANLNCDVDLHIPAGANEAEYDVLLYAPHGQATAKPDRLLPELVILHSISILID